MSLACRSCKASNPALIRFFVMIITFYSRLYHSFVSYALQSPATPFTYSMGGTILPQLCSAREYAACFTRVLGHVG